MRFFTFLQMELPWELGPPDGRYLLRKEAGPEGGEPQHVVVLSTVGAERRGLLGGRSRKRRTGRAGPEIPRVPVTRATIVDPLPLSADTQARRWLEQLDPEHEAHAGAAVLNRVLWAHRIAGAMPHVNEVSTAQALVVRAGYGEGEQVADGLWTEARELVLSRRRAGRRASVLRPQERLAVLLSGRDSALMCEELALRARLDLDAGRLALAALDLDRAYVTALKELPPEGRADLKARIEELLGLSAGVTQTAVAEQPDEQTVRHALERLEAALRARTALGFTGS